MPVVAIHHTLEGFARRAARSAKIKMPKNEKQTDNCQRKVRLKQPLLNLVQHHEATYRAIQSFIEKPPGKLRIFEIYPPKPLHSMALGSRIPALREDYKTGRLCGRYFLATVGKLLGKNVPLPRQTPKIVVPGPVVVPPAPVANDAHAPVVANAPQANDTTFNNEDLA